MLYLEVSLAVLSAVSYRGLVVCRVKVLCLSWKRWVLCRGKGGLLCLKCIHSIPPVLNRHCHREPALRVYASCKRCFLRCTTASLFVVLVADSVILYPLEVFLSWKGYFALVRHTQFPLPQSYPSLPAVWWYVRRYLVNQHEDHFRADKTYTLIQRLAHNVIKTGLRKINSSYSRVSLQDLCTKVFREIGKTEGNHGGLYGLSCLREFQEAFIYS